jgi:hypothetical protein
VSEFDGVRDGRQARFFVEYTVAAIVVKCWSNVKPFMTAIIPGASCGCFAVVEYVDHDRPTRTSEGISAEESRLFSSNFGSGAELKSRAWNTILELV